MPEPILQHLVIDHDEDEMDAAPTPSKPNADKLVAAYIKMRDKRDTIKREADEQTKAIEDQMEVIETALLDICKENGQDGGRTAHGTFTRSVKTRYWTSDWAKFYEFVRQHDALELFEQRIHQGNFKQFLTEHPDDIPEGLNADSRYAITVRRK